MLTTIIYFSFLLFLPFNTQSSKEIRIPIKYDLYNIPSVSISLGAPPQTFDFYLSSLLPGVFIISSAITDKGFDMEASETLLYNLVEIQKYSNLGKFTKGFDVKDIFVVELSKQEELKLKYFPFIVLTNWDNNVYHQGSFGLEYWINSNKREYSFIQKLFDNGMIDKQVFYIDTTWTPNMWVFGDYPKQIQSNVKGTFSRNYRTCQLSPIDSKGYSNSKWECALDSIFFDDFTILKLKAFASFSLGGNVICLPYEINNQIRDKLFSRAIDEQLCEVDLNRNTYYELVHCDESFTFSQEKTISFVFGKWNLKLKVNDLFMDKPGKKRFGISYCGQDKITIGYYFLKKEYFVIFDKERKEMGFYPTT